MRRIVITAGILLLSTSSAFAFIYSRTQTKIASAAPVTTTQQVQGTTATTNNQTTAKQSAAANNNNQSSNQEQESSGSPIYDNIRWGWNKFIDVIAPPSKN